MTFEQAHLYVEKYNPASGDLLLDFIAEKEFLFFRNQGDYAPYMHIDKSKFVPTQLLIRNCKDSIRIPEGSLLHINMKKFIDFWKPEREMDIQGESDLASVPAVAFKESNNGRKFMGLLNDSGSKILRYIPKRYITYSNLHNSESFCMDMSIEDSFQVCVWDVGQGNTNSVSDGRNTLLFDAGASVYASHGELCRILSSHKNILEPKSTLSLIISHWDCDHYNLLTAMPDSFFKSLHYAIYPQAVVTLTSKQILQRIEDNCPHPRCMPIAPAPRTTAGKCGIKMIAKGPNHTIYTGEVSCSSNRSGLLMEVHSKSGTVLLTADHTNYQVWNQMYDAATMATKRLHVVVPHHGGSCGKCNIPPKIKPGIAAVSVGKNGYGHPKPTVIGSYASSKFNVIRTNDPARRQKDIQIPL